MCISCFKIEKSQILVVKRRVFTINKRTKLFSTFFTALILLTIGGHANIPGMYVTDSLKLPNVVFILVDDLGWSDLGIYGNKYHETPNINKLAKRSIQFENAYAAAPICSPTRASILTGKSPASLNLEFVTKPVDSKHPAGKPLVEPPYAQELSLKELTFAEILNSRYKKGFFGKWHLNQDGEKYLDWGITYGPLQQGFDIGSENRGSHPYAFSAKEKSTFGNYKEGEYPADELTHEVTDFMRQNKENPFLLYWSLYYVHTPVKTRAKWLYDKYEKKLGVDNPNKINYAAFVETMDHYIGEVLNEIDRLGIDDNTVIIFTSDNGAHPGYSNSDVLRGNKWNLYEGGIRSPLLISWPGKTDNGLTSKELVTSVDLFPTICEITNTRYKPDQVEGVSLLPLINNQSINTNRNLYWHFPYYHPPINYEGTSPCSAIRSGDYKLIYFYENDKAELYDIKNDVSEKQDISSQNPVITNQLKLQLMQYLKSVNARFPIKQKSNQN